MDGDGGVGCGDYEGWEGGEVLIVDELTEFIGEMRDWE